LRKSNEQLSDKLIKFTELLDNVTGIIRSGGVDDARQVKKIRAIVGRYRIMRGDDESCKLMHF
jgi:hypothetical protein